MEHILFIIFPSISNKKIMKHNQPKEEVAGFKPKDAKK
jgi:hypothetical protein